MTNTTCHCEARSNLFDDYLTSFVVFLTPYTLQLSPRSHSCVCLLFSGIASYLAMTNTTCHCEARSNLFDDYLTPFVVFLTPYTLQLTPRSYSCNLTLVFLLFSGIASYLAMTNMTLLVIARHEAICSLITLHLLSFFLHLTPYALQLSPSSHSCVCLLLCSYSCVGLLHSSQ
jgi:hypothetical protein